MIAFIEPNNSANKNAQLFLNLHRAFKSAAKAERKAQLAAERAQKANDKAIKQAKFFLEEKVNESEASTETENTNMESSDSPKLPPIKRRDLKSTHPA
jgi:sortase (surface protein transpeptidase)